MNFEALTDYLDTLSRLNVPGCDLAVYRDHQPVYRHQAGFRDDEKQQPMEGNETFFLYSATKVFTTCAVMQLVEQGKIRLDDPVSDYLPDYAHLTVKDGDTVRPAKTVMTVRHLMSMQSGLNYDREGPEVTAVAKDVMDFVNGSDGRASVKGADYDGKIVDAAMVDALSKVPGKDQLRATLLMLLKEPATRLARVLSEKAKKEGGEAAPAA